MAEVEAVALQLSRNSRAPQQGTPVCVTSCAQRLATCVKASARPIFLDEHGTWTATLSRTLVQSSLSSRKCLTKSTGSYRENLHRRGSKDQGWSDDSGYCCQTSMKLRN